MRWVSLSDKKFPGRDDEEAYGEVDSKYHDEEYVSYTICDPRKISEPSEGATMERS